VLLVLSSYGIYSLIKNVIWPINQNTNTQF
jgi:hypothetical protein